MTNCVCRIFRGNLKFLEDVYHTSIQGNISKLVHIDEGGNDCWKNPVPGFQAARVIDI